MILSREWSRDYIFKKILNMNYKELIKERDEIYKTLIKCEKEYKEYKKTGLWIEDQDMIYAGYVNDLIIISFMFYARANKLSDEEIVNRLNKLMIEDKGYNGNDLHEKL